MAPGFLLLGDVLLNRVENDSIQEGTEMRFNCISYEDAVGLFLADKKAAGSSPATVKSYYGVLVSAWSRWLPEDLDMDGLTTELLRGVVSDMAQTDLSRNTIRSYTATMQAFLSWARDRGLCDAEIALFKGAETVPECYSADELRKLLKRPNMRKCTFTEYRTWVIINLLVNDGCRASTITEIQCQDVDFDAGVIYLRHTKRRKALTIPLGEYMASILREYLTIRKGKPSDPLFPTEDGTKMTYACLKVSVVRYNRSRGVARTGIHKFRHTFARMYLLECDGDPLRLQKLLGHSTLKMTQHYARIYDAEIAKDYDRHSPLEKLRKPDRITMPRA